MPKLKSKSWNIILRVVGALAVIICIFFQIEEGVKYVNYPKMEAEAATWKALLISFISLINLAIILFSRIWIKKMDRNAILPACIAILSIIVFYVLSCEVFKYLASRPRPRVVYQGVIEFKQWYQWQPLNALHSEFKDCKSFVSGHTSNAACLVTLLPICASLSRKENSLKIQIMCSIVGALFVFVVAFARIIGMAHYMSDVMGGILLSIAMQALVINIAPIIIKKLNN